MVAPSAFNDWNAATLFLLILHGKGSGYSFGSAKCRYFQHLRGDPFTLGSINFEKQIKSFLQIEAFTVIAKSSI